MSIYVGNSEPKEIYIGTTPVKEVYVGTTKVRPSSMPAGIYHNATLGLISLSSDGQTWYTIMDKNLGATTVYNQGDTLTDANCGYFFQRGNNYGFPHSGNVPTSRRTVNASNYGPGNYYSSSTFIVSNWTWCSAQNDNLWGATTGTNEAMQGPSPNGFHVPTKDELVALCGILTSTFSMAANSTTMGTYLKMPMAGQRSYDDAGVRSVGSYGRYWSSIPYSANNAYYLFFSSSAVGPQNNDRIAHGYSIRCFKNEAVQPDDTRTIIYQPS